MAQPIDYIGHFPLETSPFLVFFPECRLKLPSQLGYFRLVTSIDFADLAFKFYLLFAERQLTSFFEFDSLAFQIFLVLSGLFFQLDSELFNSLRQGFNLAVLHVYLILVLLTLILQLSFLLLEDKDLLALFVVAFHGLAQVRVLDFAFLVIQKRSLAGESAIQEPSEPDQLLLVQLVLRTTLIHLGSPNFQLNTPKLLTQRIVLVLLTSELHLKELDVAAWVH